MRIAMPEPIDADLLEVGLRDHRRQVGVIVFDELQWRELGDFAAMD